MKRLHVNTEDVRIRDWEDLAAIVSENADTSTKQMNCLHTRVWALNNRTDLMIIVGIIAGYKIFKKIRSLEKKVERLEEDIAKEYWAAEFERMDAKAAEEGEPDVT